VLRNVSFIQSAPTLRESIPEGGQNRPSFKPMCRAPQPGSLALRMHELSSRSLETSSTRGGEESATRSITTVTLKKRLVL
jgi:hypothetical protein